MDIDAPIKTSFRNSLEKWGAVFLLLFLFIIGLWGLSKAIGYYSPQKDAGEWKETRLRQDDEADLLPVDYKQTVAPISAQDHIRGARDAKMVIVEFSDLECPFCKQFHATMQEIIIAYPNDVMWVYRHFPILSTHPRAVKEAEASECAAEIGGNQAFWQYVDRIFEITPSNNTLDISSLYAIARELALPINLFTQCLESGKYTSKVENEVAQALASKARSTPFSLLITAEQTVPLVGAWTYEGLKALIDDTLKKLKP